VRELVVLGGPNGAGKTTAAQVLVPRKLGIAEFINADEIARGLSPFNPDGAALAAGRLMLQRMRSLASGEQSFAIETTCSGRGHLGFLRQCKSAGWRITLVFLWLPSPQIAIDRVERRVAAGGHAVHPKIITRRYRAGLRNMCTDYLPMADVAAIYDNAEDEPILIAERISGADLMIHDAERWKSIERASQCPT
jgi:predicted ABC-type ATPase